MIAYIIINPCRLCQEVVGGTVCFTGSLGPNPSVYSDASTRKLLNHVQTHVGHDTGAVPITAATVVMKEPDQG